MVHYQARPQGQRNRDLRLRSHRVPRCTHLLLLDRRLHQSLPLPSPRAPLRALDNDGLREPLFAPRELLGALLLALFVALAERGHGGGGGGADPVLFDEDWLARMAEDFGGRDHKYYYRLIMQQSGLAFRDPQEITLWNAFVHAEFEKLNAGEC